MEPAVTIFDSSQRLCAYALLRKEAYAVLAALLSRRPSRTILTILRTLQWDPAVPEPLARTLETLRTTGSRYPLNDVRAEFDRLFVGLGCGELVPYASWYRDKESQSLQLLHLRSDLVRFGVQRQKSGRESDDHAGSLCEAMALICRRPQDFPRATQPSFFQNHMAPWMALFFKDLKTAKSAAFYKAVGLFGLSFLEHESLFLQCDLAV